MLKSRKLISYGASISLIVSFLVLGGWVFQIEVVTSVFPGLPTMKFNTALCFLVLSIFVWLKANGMLKLGYLYLLPILIFVISAISLIEAIIPGASIINEFLVEDIYSRTKGSNSPGKMSAATAFCFLLISSSLILSRRKELRKVTQLMLSVVSILALLGIIGFVFQVPSESKIPAFSTMALHTAILFGVLSYSTSFFYPTIGITGILNANKLGSKVFRKILPVTILALISLGGVFKLADLYGVMDLNSGGLAIFVGLNIVISLVLLTSISAKLNATDESRFVAEKKLQKANQNLEKKVIERTHKLQSLKDELDLLLERFKLATNAGKIGVWDYDLVNNSLVWDASMYKLYGIDPEDFSGAFEAWESCLHPDDRTHATKAVEDAINGIADFDVEFRVVAKSGNVSMIKVNAIVLRDDTGKAVRMVGSNWDISEEKERELALLESNALNRAFVSQAPTAIAMLDDDLRYVAASEKWIAEYNLGGKEIIGEKHSAFFPNAKDHGEDFHLRALAGERVSRDEEEITTPEGHKKWLKWETAPWYKTNNSIGGIVMYTEDITNRIKAEHKFRSLMEMAPDALVIVNKQGEIQLVNAQTERLFGYNKEELLGQKVEVLIPERFKKDHHKHRDGFFAHSKFRPMGQGLDLWGAKKDGVEFPIEISLGPIETEDGVLVSAAIRDISDRKKAENKFRSLMEMAPDALVIVNKQGEIQLVNAQTERLFGYNKEELLGQKVEVLIPERFKKDHHKHRDGFFSHSKFRPMGQGLDLWGAKKDGTEFPIEISLGPIETEDGVLVSAAIRDISDRKKAENKFRSLMEMAPDALVIVNKKGEIQLTNAQAEKLFAYGKEELLGQKVEVLIPDRFKDGHHKHRDGFFAHSKFRPMGEGLDLWGVKKDGTEFPIEISLGPIETEDGILVSAAIRDITERKEIEKERKQTMNLVGDQNKRLLNFAHIVSHNLRTHSGNFEMILNLIDQEDDNGAKQEMMGMLRDASGQLSETITNLNEVVSIQTNVNQETRKLNVLKYIRKTLKILQPEIDKLKAEIKIDVTESIEISHNPSYLESILLNFTTNALKYRHLERAPVIHFCAEDIDNYVQLQIQDNGRGIDLKRYSKKLFGMYKTFHGNNDARGIGLFITKNQIEALGGSIEVESEVNVGTSFKIKFKK